MRIWGAELAGSLPPHSMRHAFATLNLDARASLRDLRDAMGHASPRSTRRYDRNRGNLDRSPVTCSPGTSAAPDEPAAAVAESGVCG